MSCPYVHVQCSDCGFRWKTPAESWPRGDEWGLSKENPCIERCGSCGEKHKKEKARLKSVVEGLSAIEARLGAIEDRLGTLLAAGGHLSQKAPVFLFVPGQTESRTAAFARAYPGAAAEYNNAVIGGTLAFSD